MWYILSWDRRPFVQALGSAAVLALLLAGCSGNQATAKAAPTGKAEQKPAAAGSAAGAAGAGNTGKPAATPEVVPVQPADANKDVVPPEGPIPLAPPDGKWLTDEYGRKYFVHKIAKVPQAWAWVEEGKKVQLVRGLQFDVVSYDDKSFDVKIYGTDPKMAADIASSVKRTSPEDLEKVAATYKVAVPSSDRLLLAPFSQGLPQRGQWRQGFAVADINGDGHPDIVHGPPRKGGSTPALFLGDGKGRWRRWTEATFPPIPFDYGNVAVADFNGDGKADLAIASHLRGITVLVGDGKGGFTPWSQGIDFEAGDQDRPVFTSRAIAAVDWNADGRPDLLAWGEGPRLATARLEGSGGADFSRGSRGALLYLNQGDGTWKKQDAAVQDQSYGDALVVTDFDKDGKPDFAAASALTGNRTLVYLHQQDGSWKGVPSEALRPQAIFRGVAAGDFNRDGRVDLAVGYASNELGVGRTGVDVLLARADGSWDRRALGVQDGRDGIWALGAGDLDGDGALDLVGITGAGDAWVFLGDGKGTFTREQSPELGPPDSGCTGYHVELEDLDGDGAAELVAGYAGEGSTSPIAGGLGKCASGGSLRAWKASRQGR